MPVLGLPSDCPERASFTHMEWIVFMKQAREYHTSDCRCAVNLTLALLCVGSLVVVGESIEEFEGVDLPPCKGMLNKRAIMQFSAVVTPYSPTSGHVRRCIVSSFLAPHMRSPFIGC